MPSPFGGAARTTRVRNLPDSGGSVGGLAGSAVSSAEECNHAFENNHSYARGRRLRAGGGTSGHHVPESAATARDGGGSRHRAQKRHPDQRSGQDAFIQAVPARLGAQRRR